MINYSKVRDSVEKNSSKKSLSKAPSANKSHTNSINIRLTQDSVQQIKIPLKAIFKDKTEATFNKIYQPHSHQKKNSLKLQSDEKENLVKKKDNIPYDVTIFRPFQQTNRYLQTERIPKDYSKANNERTPVKQALRLRTEYHKEKQLRTDYTDATPEKKKETSTKHTTENEGKMIKVSTQNLRSLMDKLMREQQEVKQLRRELQFYRANASKSSCNPVLRALKF